MTVQKLFIIIAIIAAIITAFRYYRKNSDGLLINFCQYFIGLLFIFSGFVKAIDPLGTSYKMHEYFESFAQDGFHSFWEMMSEWAVPISIFMIVLEIVLGCMIIIGRHAKMAAIGLLGLNLFFLFLTGYSYLSGYCLTPSVIVISALLLLLLFLAAFISHHQKRFYGITLISVVIILYFLFCKFTGSGATCEFTPSKMKVTDCGCFGDFMKLKTWETFYKDIFLTLISLVIVRYYHKIKLITTDRISKIFVFVGLTLSLIFCLMNTYWNEPPIDFRPYAVGSNINEKMKEIEPKVSEFILKYKNNATGKVESFKIDNMPADIAENWTYDTTIENVIKEGIPAPIHNLRFTDLTGGDVTQSLLNEENISFWIVIYNTKKSNLDFFNSHLVPFAQEMKKQGINVYCLLGNSTAEFDAKTNEMMDVVKADETALKTMIRSNPGIMKIQNGKVISKWHYHQFSKEKIGL